MLACMNSQDQTHLMEVAVRGDTIGAHFCLRGDQVSSVLHAARRIEHDFIKALACFNICVVAATHSTGAGDRSLLH
jgi:hypothetical protein